MCTRFDKKPPNGAESENSRIDESKKRWYNRIGKK